MEIQEPKIKVKASKKPKLVATTSNVAILLKSAADLNTSSRKLKRLFEKNTYQKKTQLTVLKRYKRRLDAIEREDEERRKRAAKRKVKLPSIKKFAGSFFAPEASKDPFKAIAALSGFNAITKLSKGDFLGAIGPGLMAIGMAAGPGLVASGVGYGLSKLRPKAKPGFDLSGRKVSSAAQERYLNRYGEKAYKRRFGTTNLKNIKSPTTAGEVVAESSKAGGKAAKAFGRLGKAIIPGVGAVLGAADTAIRAQEGDVTGAAISGTSATLDVATAAAAATGIGLVAVPFLGLASMTLDLVNFARDITGISEAESKKNKGIQSKLEEYTKKQKELIAKRPQSNSGILFEKSLSRYEKVISKFEIFVQNFKSIGKKPEDTFTEGEPMRPSGYDNLMSPGTGEVPTTPEGLPALPKTNTIPGQAYNAPRSYGGHTGQDFDISGNEKFYSRLGGQVIFARNVGGEYGNVVEVYNKDLGVTEVIAEANHIMANIKEGMYIPPGTPVVYGERTRATKGGSVGVIHYEIVKGAGGISVGSRTTMSPLQYLNSKEYKDYIKKKVNVGGQTQRPSGGSPTKSVVRSFKIDSFTYTEWSDGTYTQNGKQIDKSIYEAVKKNHQISSNVTRDDSRIAKRTSYENNSNVIFVAMNPSIPQTSNVNMGSSSPVTLIPEQSGLNIKELQRFTLLGEGAMA